MLYQTSRVGDATSVSLSDALGWLSATLIVASAAATEGVLVLQGLAAAGHLDPTTSGTTLASGSLDFALVFREGLESLIVLATILTGLRVRRGIPGARLHGNGGRFGSWRSNWFVVDAK